jgi:hypothetical protein
VVYRESAFRRTIDFLRMGLFPITEHIAVPNRTGLYRGLLKAEALGAGERDSRIEVSHL